MPAKQVRTTLALLPLAGLTLTVLAACGGVTVIAPSPRGEALAYIRAHPVADRAGMTTGVILAADASGFADAAAEQAHCPAALTASTASAAGDLPGCGAWSATAETASGQVVTLSCGSITARVECPLWRHANGYVPSPGDYLRFLSSGQVTSPGDIQVIGLFAVPGLLGQAPGPGVPWITAPAGGQ